MIRGVGLAVRLKSKLKMGLICRLSLLIRRGLTVVAVTVLEKIPAGAISLHNIGMIEAAIIGSLVATYALRLPMRTNTDILAPMAVGAGLYHLAPP